MSALKREHRPVIHETGSGCLYSDTLRSDFKQHPNDLPSEYEFGCLDAPNTISTGSHYKSRSHPIPSFVFR